MPLRPWYKIVTPREDLREGKPLDASEFAVHLDQVREGRAPADYQKPERFLERTYLTKNLTTLASEVIRRLSGERTETNAIFNLATQFGGGKTHALTLLYHLARSGPAASKWAGVPSLLGKAGVTGVPTAEAAVFVGTEFDSISGRGGNDGTPLRKTPWAKSRFSLEARLHSRLSPNTTRRAKRPEAKLDIGQHAGFRMRRLDRDKRAFPEAIQIPRESPQLELRHHTDLISSFEQGAVSFRRLKKVQSGRLSCSRGRGCEPFSAQLRYPIHFSPGLFEAFGPPRVVINYPFRESNRALEAQPQVCHAFFQILQGTSIIDILLD